MNASSFTSVEPCAKRISRDRNTGDIDGKNYAEILNAQDARTTELFRAHPNTMRVRRAIMQAVQKPHALDAKTSG